MIAPVLAVLLGLTAFITLSTWSSWRARVRRLARLRAEWGHAVSRSRDLEGVADLFRSHAAAGVSLDDRTWNDLLRDDVFAYLDRTESSIGRQMLYYRLRSAPSPQSLGAFDALMARVADDPARRERAQAVLARLLSPSGYYVHRLARPDALDRRRWHVVFPLWTAVSVLTMSLAFFLPQLLFVAVSCYFVNLVIRILTARRAMGQIAWFRYVGPLLSAANGLAGLGTDETTAITGSLTSDLVALRRVGSIARWVSRDPLATNDLVFAVLEFFNVLEGKRHVVLAATHDGELVDLLRDSYDVCHFGDAVGPDGLVFDYHLTPGPATSRNAIALLELNGAPESVVTRALLRAAALDRQRRQWKEDPV